MKNFQGELSERSSSNKNTVAQSLKLLGELLMERSNVRIMVQYVGNIGNLMLVMNLLKDPSKTIQFEAFHVFKVFVANPRKPEKIKEILISNKEKLLRYLAHFLEEKGTDHRIAIGLLTTFVVQVHLVITNPLGVPICIRYGEGLLCRVLPTLAVSGVPQSDDYTQGWL